MKRMLSIATLLAMQLASGAAAEDRDWQKRLTAEIRLCESAPENKGTLSQALCYQAEAARQDARLNETWRHLAVDRKEKIREDERHWVRQRDAICKSEASDYINSTASYMFNVCLVRETIRRTIWLERKTG
jgi:uncharacterized protein YecT (DUF1311 family)